MFFVLVTSLQCSSFSGVVSLWPLDLQRGADNHKHVARERGVCDQRQLPVKKMLQCAASLLAARRSGGVDAHGSGMSTAMSRQHGGGVECRQVAAETVQKLYLWLG